MHYAFDEQTNLWIIFCISCMKRNRLQVEPALEIDRRDYISAEEWGNEVQLQVLLTRCKETGGFRQRS